MKQSTGMSAFEFILRMKAHNNMLDSKLSDSELLQLAMRALLPMYTTLLASREINTFQELNDATKKFESFATSDTVKQPTPSSSYASKVFSNNDSEFNSKHYNKYSNNNKVERYVPASKSNFNNSTYRRPQNNYVPSYGQQYNKSNYVATNQPATHKSPPGHNVQGFPKSTQNKIICQFCKIPGHTAENCRKKAAIASKTRIGTIHNEYNSENTENSSNKSNKPNNFKNSKN